MKILTKIICLAFGAGLVLTPAIGSAATGCGGCGGGVTALADQAKPDAKAKPYPLDTCIVSDEKLDADPEMASYSFVYEGQEIKLCCKSCKKKFDKDPAKYLKKLADASAKK
jgi:YHS domain-containing protein